MVRIITDSGSDILPDRAAKWNITVLPLTVRFGNDEYLDGETLSRDDFYDKLEASKKELPKTSQISPQTYESEFEKALAAGDEVVCLTISSGLSGCCQSATLAADGREGIYVVDTTQACGSQFILVEHAVQLRDEGKSAKKIADIIFNERSKSRQITILDTLEYLQRGGRISKTVAFAGTLLGIKPIVTFQNGVVEMLAKARGTKNSHNMLMQIVAKKGGVDRTKPFVFAYTGNQRELIDKFIGDCAPLYEGIDRNSLTVSRAGATIGTYTGPGVVSFSFFEDAEN